MTQNSDDFTIYVNCERLVYKFLRVLEGNQANTADLFTTDGQAFQLKGREAIREHFTAIEDVDDNINVNISTNLIIEIEDETHASASNWVTHYAARPEADDLTDPNGAKVSGEVHTPQSITRWHWQFTCIEEEWLISKLSYPEPVLLRKDVIDEL